MKGSTFQKNTSGKRGLRSKNILKHTSNLLYLLLLTRYTLRKYHGMWMVIRSIRLHVKKENILISIRTADGLRCTLVAGKVWMVIGRWVCALCH